MFYLKIVFHVLKIFLFLMVHSIGTLQFGSFETILVSRSFFFNFSNILCFFLSSLLAINIAGR